MTDDYALPAQSLEAEQACLGSAMLERSALEVAIGILKPSDFYRPAHEDVFRALIALHQADEPVDLITCQEELRKHGKLEDCGGTEYLMALVESVPTAAHVQHYAEIVLEKSLVRQHQAINLEYQARYSSPDANPEHLSVWLTSQLDKLAERTKKDEPEWKTLADILCGELKPVEWIIDKIIPRYGITMITGDPSCMKSWIAMAIGYAVTNGFSFLDKWDTLKGGCPVLIHDIENGEQENQRRMQRLATGFITQGKDLNTTAPLYVTEDAFQLDDGGDIARNAALLNSKKIGLVIADPFIHSLPDGADENSSVDIGRFWERLRKLIKLTGCTFIFIHHSKKQNPNSSNDASQMLRGSSAIRGGLDSHLFCRRLAKGPVIVEHDKLRQGQEVESFSIVFSDDDTATFVEYGGESNEVPDQLGAAQKAIVTLLVDNNGPMLKAQILEHLGRQRFSKASVTRALIEMKNKGKLTLTKKGKQSQYGLSMDQGAWWTGDE